MRAPPAPPSLEGLPGHSIRRLHQIAVALFLQETEPLGLTPVQYAALNAIAQQPGLDQRRLAAHIATDASTTGSVIDRLEARGCVIRELSPTDRRVRLLSITQDGQVLLKAATRAMLRAQQRILEPLPEEERPEFLRMLAVLIEGNKEASRAQAM
jgi:DNA-binding MarR family transcriptional regulator